MEPRLERYGGEEENVDSEELEPVWESDTDEEGDDPYGFIYYRNHSNRQWRSPTGQLSWVLLSTRL